ncbi:MAG: hypothetical protein Q8794_02100, partial [Candidatus Phytoplasma australasiaticum]|nr:hypothetical protein [Candidatus Phytoplasma australasiaticum]
SIKQQHRIEGSMYEAYIAREMANFCSYYFASDVQCSRSRPNHHDDGGVKTIVCITHDMNLVAQYATRVIFMEKGNIVFDNSKEIFFKNFELQKFNLYEPQTFRILKLIEKSLNIPFHPVYSEEECLSYLRKFYLGGI